MKGVYVLIIMLQANVRLRIGSLGECTFSAGLYAYVGSAQINLEKRVARHLRKEKRLFWHIDHLLDNRAAKVICVYFKAGTKAEECRLANLLKANSKEISGFGCSDCKCSSHLFFAGSFDFLKDQMHQLELDQVPAIR